MWSIDKLPSWSPQARKSTGMLYAFFRKPWDRKQTSIPLDTSSEHEARVIGPSRVLDYLNANDPTLKAPGATDATWEGYLGMFLKDEYINQKDNTKRGVKSAASKFIQALKSPYIKDITWEITRDYFDQCKADYEPKGVANRLIIIRKFMDYCHDSGVLAKNYATDYPLPSSEDFHINEITWEPDEFTKFYLDAPKADKEYLWDIYHTGMDLADWFFMRKRDIKEVKGGFIITKLREKALSKFQVIMFPLDNCPAKGNFIRAWKAAKNPDDRIHALDYEDKEYRQFQWTTQTRRRKHWKKVFGNMDCKTLKQLRHTFVTECVSGVRFGEPVPQAVLEMWMGWRPGSNIGARIYTHIKAIDTLKWMPKQLVGGAILEQ